MNGTRATGVAAIFACGLACTGVDLYPVTRNPGIAGGGAAAGGAAPVPGSGGDGGAMSLDCDAPALPPGDSMRSVLVDGARRSYLLHVPTSYDGLRPAPLVVDFHGIGETAASERESSPYPAALERDGVIMAFPDGLRGPAGTGWNVGPCCVAAVDDVAFARAVVADVQASTCIDAKRVYAVGVLTGGGMAHYLACHAADVFAAVAPAAFDLLEENVDDCLPSRPVTVVSFRTTADVRVPYTGGPSSLVPGMPLTFLGAQATFSKWAEIDGCNAGPSAEDANGCSAYSQCAGDTEVVLCTSSGLEQHADADVAWRVLREHTL